MYSNRMKNLNLPENLFSNLGELKSKELATKKILEEQEEMENEDTTTNDYSQDISVKMTNYADHQEYRDRIDKMYEEIKGIVPIDSEIDDTLFFNNYVEKGIVVKPKIASLKQFWTEYRLISNEKINEKNEPIHQELQDSREISDLDMLFESLSKRVTEINQYIDELKDMRINMDKASQKLEEDKEKLEQDKEDLANERLEFNDYKQQEETKIANDKENLKINFERLQTIIDDLDKKIVSIDQ